MALLGMALWCMTLLGQQLLLAEDAPPVTAHAAVLAHHPVARNHQRYRVGGAGRARGLSNAWATSW